MVDNPNWAIVTGASSGIGKATALRFARSGYALLLVARDPSRLDSVAVECCHTSKRPAHCFSVNLCDETAIKTLFQKIKAITPTLSALVNCAGVMYTSGVMTTKAEQFNHQLFLNTVAPFTMAQYASRMMVRQRQGSIVNVSSVVAQQGSEGQVAYATSKSAIDGMTRSLARELGGLGIRVNAVSPGIIDTPLLGDFDDAKRKKLMDKIVLRRLGEAKEIAEVIDFLCSECASYIQGQIISVDGGLHL